MLFWKDFFQSENNDQLSITNSNRVRFAKLSARGFQEAILGRIPSDSSPARGFSTKKCLVVTQGSKSSSDNWGDHASDLSISQEVPSGSESRLRSVIGRINHENESTPCWEDQVSIYPSRGDGTQQDVIVDTWSQRGSRKQDNQVEFEKQLCGSLLSVAMSPDNHLEGTSP
jgi:hypothetical protein